MMLQLPPPEHDAVQHRKMLQEESPCFKRDLVTAGSSYTLAVVQNLEMQK